MFFAARSSRPRSVVSSCKDGRRASLIERLERRALFAAVASVSPADLGIGVAVNAHVSIKFGTAMQRASLDSTTLDLRQNLTSIPARISYNANSFVATIDSSTPLDYSSTYSVVVKGGANGVIDSGSGTLTSDYTFSFTTAANPTTGPGGPILVITKAANPINSYYAEILRAEGLNEFATARLSTVTAASLLNYKVVILGEMTLTSAQATMISGWVTNDGGKLIAMRPDAQLAGLLGLTVTGATINDTYLSVDTSTIIGGGITADSIQYHSTADRYTLSGATKLADLFSNSTTATGNPAVTIRNVGANGGQAAAFVFDLAKSVVQTRQGNPAWSGQERDGNGPVRSDDLFFGGGSADWVDLTKVQIPQADEQQRLLANMINQMTAPTLPLPRFWYFPNGKKAVVNMTGDDHLNGGTAYRWSAYLSLGNSGGQPILGTSYMYPGPGAITDSTAAFYQAVGFDPQLHVDVSDANDVPRNWTSYADLDSLYSSQVAAYTAFYSSIPTPTTNRTHAVVWSDYDTQPQVEFAHRVRLDTNYYYWPGSWIANRPGMFTGSGMPMRFAKADGTLIDVYQAATQITDENGATEPYHINTLLDNATGSKGYYGAFTINAHTDLPNSAVSDAVIASAQAHDIPVMTAEDLMEWTDARNGSSFSNHAYNTSTHMLTFDISTAAGAAGLQAMVPVVAENNRNVSAISVNGSPVAFNVQTIKGVDYAFFNAAAGAVSVSYAADTAAPTITGKTPAAGATNVSVIARPTITLSEDVNPATTTFTLTDSLTNAVSGAVSYSAGTHTFTFTPTSNLTAGGTYTLNLTGAQDLAGNAMAGTTTWTFTVAGTGPFTIWDNSVSPQMPYFADSPIEVGVKFKADYNGFITGVRFYKSAQNNGLHEGTLYNTAGFALASATFSNETSSGWQTVTFSSPVAITPNTTYIAAYHTDTGYAADPSYFDRQFDSLYLHAVSDSTSGGNGLYRYTTTPLMPNSSFHATNYWVDVVYTLSSTDLTPPTVTSTNPINNATAVALASTLSATFSEAVQSGTINFTLKDPANNVIAGSTSYNSGTQTVTFTPASALSGSTTYTTTVSGAQDAAGNAMAAPVIWSFTTVDNTPPVVTVHSPLSGATNVSAGATVTATFSEDVQAGTITFTVKDALNQDVTGVVAYDAPTRTATFTPSAPLSGFTPYTATVSGVQDLAGNVLVAPVTWSFTTADATAPSAAAGSEVPTAGGTAFDFTVTYTDSGSGLDASTFDGNDITVTGPNGFSADAAFISVNAPGNGSPRTVTYRITAPGGLWNVLDNGSYSINLNANQVKDISNNAIASGAVRAFNPALPFAYQTGAIVHVDFYGTVPAITLGAGGGDITAGDGTTTLPFSSVTSVVVTGTANADTVDFNGPVTPSITFNGGAGTDVLNVNSGTYAFDADAGSGTPNLMVQVNAGQVLFNATQHLTTLNIAGGGRATFSANGNRTLYTTNLSIGASGTLDLNDNDLVVQNGSFATLHNLVLEGYSPSIDLAKTGIISTHGQGQGGNTILALFDNALAGFAEWPPNSGETIGANAIVGKYTYLGDTNMDGQVTAQDYTAVDANIGTSVNVGISWLYGDTNFDGNIDATDYTGIDASLGLGAGSPLAALVARPASPLTGSFFSRKRIDTSAIDKD